MQMWAEQTGRDIHGITAICNQQNEQRLHFTMKKVEGMDEIGRFHGTNCMIEISRRTLRLQYIVKIKGEFRQ